METSGRYPSAMHSRMSHAEALECLELLTAADAILLGAGDRMLAAHLSLVIETVRERVAAERLADACGTGRRPL